MKYLSLIGLMLFSVSSMANDYQKDIDSFFTQFEAGNVNQAVDDIYASNPYVKALPDQIKNVKTQLGAMPGLAGDIQYIKKLDEYLVHDSLVHVTYLVVYDRMPTKFEFQFFKLKSGWRIFSFSFDDSVFDLIEPQVHKRAFEGK